MPDYYVTVDLIRMEGYNVTAKNKTEAADKAINKAWGDNPDAGEVTIVSVEKETK